MESRNLELLYTQLHNNKIHHCPYCNFTGIVKFGKFNKTQRYKCKNISCNRTFSEHTSTISSYSKKDSSLWVQYIKLFNSGKSLRFISQELNISLGTAFFWRRKIMDGIFSE